MKVKGNTIEYKGWLIDLSIEVYICPESINIRTYCPEYGNITDHSHLEQAIAWIDDQEAV